MNSLGFHDDSDARPICNPALAKTLLKKLNIEGSGEKFMVGKYKGHPYREIFEEDPMYIRWLLITCNNKGFKEDIDNIAAILKSM